MDDLCVNIRKELRTQSVDGVRSGDIYITPDPAFIPQGISIPCINIKDGKIKHVYAGSESKELTFYIRITIWVKLTAKEAALVGSSQSGRVGIHDICKRVIEILENNTLEIQGVESAEIHDELPSQFYRTRGRDNYQRKELVFKYYKEQ